SRGFEGVCRTIPCAIAGFRDIAIGGRRAAHRARRREIRLTDATAITRIGLITGRTRLVAACRAGRLERIGWAVVRYAVAAFGDVACACCRAADAGALRMCGTGSTRPRAAFGEVACAGRRAAYGAARLERVCGTGCARAGASLRYI